MPRFIKGDKDKSSRPAPDSSPTEEFDFAAIARDLGAENGPSAFDSLLGKPVEAPVVETTAETEVQPVKLPATEAPQAEDVGFAELFHTSPQVALTPHPAPPATQVIPATATEALPAPVLAPEPIPTTQPPAIGVPTDALAIKPKRSPLVPILGVVAILVIAGGAYTLTRPSPEPEVTLPTEPSPPVDRLPIAPPDIDMPPAPPKQVAPPIKTASSGNSLKPLTPQLRAQLKALWNQGKAAKGRKDYAGARRYWQQALQLRPEHPGFEESIAKLPAQP